MMRLCRRWLFWSLLTLAILAGCGYVWYRSQSHETQTRVQQQAHHWLGQAREIPWIPREAHALLDWLTDQIPHHSTVIAAEAFRGDRTYTYAGIPLSGRRLTVLQNQGYLVGYDEQRRNPAWVAYRVFPPQSFYPPARPEEFLVDRRTWARVQPHEYRRSGYDRGHMAPNLAIALLYGPQAQRETFLMSNILPQTAELNRGIWRRLEARIIRRYASRFQEIWVIVGPVYSETSAATLRTGIAIPYACFMILLDEHEQGLRTLSFLIPQNIRGDEDPALFLTSVRQIEQRTGLNFFSELPDDVEEQLESLVSPRLW